jgi:hypothetical protein
MLVQPSALVREVRRRRAREARELSCAPQDRRARVLAKARRRPRAL